MSDVPCRFLDLPRELRDLVYQHLLPSRVVVRYEADILEEEYTSTSPSPYFSGWGLNPQEVAIMSSNRQIYHETTAILLARAEVSLFVDVDSSDMVLRQVIHSILTSKFSQVSGISITVALNPYGSTTWDDVLHQAEQLGYLLRAMPKIRDPKFTIHNPDVPFWGGSSDPPPGLLESYQQIAGLESIIVTGNNGDSNDDDGLDDLNQLPEFY